jgi:hypothetical protein
LSVSHWTFARSKSLLELKNPLSSPKQMVAANRKGKYELFPSVLFPSSHTRNNQMNQSKSKPRMKSDQRKSTYQRMGSICVDVNIPSQLIYCVRYLQVIFFVGWSFQFRALLTCAMSLDQTYQSALVVLHST